MVRGLRSSSRYAFASGGNIFILVAAKANEFFYGKNGRMRYQIVWLFLGFALQPRHLFVRDFGWLVG